MKLYKRAGNRFVTATKQDIYRAAGKLAGNAKGAGRPQIKITCDKCGKSGSTREMRYHKCSPAPGRES